MKKSKWKRSLRNAQTKAFKVATALPAAILNTMQKEINLSISAGDGCEQFQQKSPPMPD